MRILAIETSCDETAIALLKASGGLRNPKFKILKNLIASQIKIHAPFGGVVPNLAKREHLKNLPVLFKKLKTKNQKLKTINLICVTVGPGLEPALWTGINFAQEIYSDIRLTTSNLQPKLIGVSHLDGHLYSFLLGPKSYKLKAKSLFPSIALIISGGHTILLLMENLTHYKKLGETRDDAVGECFDKVARLLGLPYPGGPEIEKIAEKGNSKAINFPRPMMNQKNYDFSFSGLKTAVLYYLRDNPLETSARGGSASGGKSYKLKADIAASFQKAAFDVLINKAVRAAKEFKAKSIMVSGGVAANKTLKKELSRAIKEGFPKSKPELFITKFPTDNALMVAAASYINFLRKKNYKLEAQGNLGL